MTLGRQKHHLSLFFHNLECVKQRQWKCTTEHGHYKFMKRWPWRHMWTPGEKPELWESEKAVLNEVTFFPFFPHTVLISVTEFSDYSEEITTLRNHFAVPKTQMQFFFLALSTLSQEVLHEIRSVCICKETVQGAGLWFSALKAFSRLTCFLRMFPSSLKKRML